MNNILKIILGLVILLSVFGQTFAQEVHDPFRGTFRGQIKNISEPREVQIGWNNTIATYYRIDLQVSEGPQKGEMIFFESDFPEIKVGDKVFFNYIVDIGGNEVYSIVNVDRRGGVIFFLLLFVFVIILFGRWQGFRSIMALAGSFFAIFYILLPGILNGWPPLLAGSLVSFAILFFAIFLTHGFNRESVVAYSGTMIAVILTGILAHIAVSVNRLSGFSEDHSVILNFSTGGTLNFSGLLLSAIIIGTLGILDDIAITQAAIVAELYDSNKNITKREVYRRAMRVGREHVGALVNTLVLTYTGGALPMLLLFKHFNYTFDMALNLEIFAAEIIRTTVGSIGLVLTVPIVTFLAAVFLYGHKSKFAEKINKE